MSGNPAREQPFTLFLYRTVPIVEDVWYISKGAAVYLVCYLFRTVPNVGDVWYTSKGSAVYAIFPAWPKNDRLQLRYTVATAYVLVH